MLLIFIFLISNSLMEGYDRYAKGDSFLAVLISGAIGILICLAIYRLTVLFPGMGFYDILCNLFPKWLAFMSTGIYALICLYLGSGYIAYIGEFVRTSSLDGDMLLPFGIMILLVVIYFARAIPADTGRFIQFILPAIVIMLLIILGVGITGASYSPFPLLKNGRADFFKGVLNYCLMPYGSIILLFPFFKYGEGIRKRTLIIPTALSAIILSAAFLFTVMILGHPTVEMMKFPSYMALSAVNISRFFERIEIAGFIVFVICHIIKIGICGVFFVSTFSRGKRAKTNIAAIIFGLSAFVCALTVPFNITDGFCERIIYPIFFMILPIFIYFFAEIKHWIIAKRNKM